MENLSEATRRKSQEENQPKKKARRSTKSILKKELTLNLPYEEKSLNSKERTGCDKEAAKETGRDDEDDGTTESDYVATD